MLVSKTFDELSVGDKVSVARTITNEMVQLFAAVSGDTNPVHLDEEFAQNTVFEGRIAHGMLAGALISAAISSDMPGPGTVYLNQSLRFIAPIKIGQSVTVELRVMKKNPGNHSVRLRCNVRDDNGRPLVTGQAEVIAPLEKVCLGSSAPPAITLAQLQSVVGNGQAEA